MKASKTCWAEQLAPEEAVYTSRQYLLTGRLTRDEVERVAGDLLANSLIQRWEIRGIEDWAEGHDTNLGFRRSERTAATARRVHSLESADDAALLQLSDSRMLALSLDEMQAIRRYYRRSRSHHRTPRPRLAGVADRRGIGGPGADLVRALQA